MNQIIFYRNVFIYLFKILTEIWLNLQRIDYILFECIPSPAFIPKEDPVLGVMIGANDIDTEDEFYFTGADGESSLKLEWTKWVNGEFTYLFPVRGTSTGQFVESNVN